MLELQNICYRVSTPEGEQDILKNVSITIPDHKLVVFTGPNGGGKTTLAKVIMGLVQPTSGRVLYNGEDVTDLSITERAKRGISYGFQQPPRFKGITVHDLLLLAAGLVGAAARMRPSKSVMDMEVSSLKKKYKDKKFAAGCSRDVINTGAERLGWTIEELMEKTILAMRSCEESVNKEMETLA